MTGRGSTPIYVLAVSLFFLPSASILILIAEGEPPGKNTALHAGVTVAARHVIALAIFLVRASPAAAHALNPMT